MEWSIHVGSSADLAGDLVLERFANESGAVKRLSAAFGNVRFDRCAYGTEFCEHLIPGLDPLCETYTAARDRRLAFTFLTPYVSEAGISKLRPLLRCLQELGPA